MKKPALTIAIPTYNGASSIKYVLEALNKANIGEYIIEIVISDNCSNDSTETICKTFKPKNSIWFNYSRNLENIGFDNNVLKVVSLCQSDYVWICSDNEVIIDFNGIIKIIKMIEKYTPTFIFLEHENEIILNDCKPFYDNGNDFFRATKFKGGLISNCVINKSVWNRIDFAPYIGKQWIHFAYQIEALSPINQNIYMGGGILIDKIFKSIPTMRTWGECGSFIDVGLSLLDIFSNMQRLGYSQDVIRQAKLVIKGGYPKNLILARKQGYAFNFHKIKQMKKYYGEFPSFYLRDIPAMILPLCVVRIILSIYKITLIPFRQIRYFLATNLS